MKIFFVLYLFIAVACLRLTTDAPQAFADGSCLTLNNGGTTTRQICLTPSPSNAPANQTNDPQQSQQDNKGQHVYPTSSNTKNTPNTGPEDWVLPSLILLGGLGFILRNKANPKLTN